MSQVDPYLYKTFCDRCPSSNPVLKYEQFCELFGKFQANQPRNQSKSDLNVLCKALKLKDPTVPIRTEIALAQVLFATNGKTVFLPSFKDIAENYCLSEELFDESKNQVLVKKNNRFRIYVYYMMQAIPLFNPHSQRDFICNVVALLSKDKMKIVTGGGTESIGTAMRYRVFEIATGHFRPKTRQAALEGRDLRVRQANLLLPIPTYMFDPAYAQERMDPFDPDVDFVDVSGEPAAEDAPVDQEPHALVDNQIIECEVFDAMFDYNSNDGATDDEDDDTKSTRMQINPNSTTVATVNYAAEPALALLHNSVNDPLLFSFALDYPATEVWDFLAKNSSHE